MHSAQECRRQADALATLALMFPEKGDAYRDAERRWRDLEAKTVDRELHASPRPSKTPASSVGVGVGAPVRSGP